MPISILDAVTAVTLEAGRLPPAKPFPSAARSGDTPAPDRRHPTLPRRILERFFAWLSVGHASAMPETRPEDLRIVLR